MTDHIRRIAAKRLSQVEIDPEQSNQHEFNGTASLRELLGKTDFRKRQATFIWIGDDRIVEGEGQVSWYDAREDHPARTEWRLYYPSNKAVEHADPGDLLIITQNPDGEIWILIVSQTSPLINHLIWMSGLDKDLGTGFQIAAFAPSVN